MIKKFNDFNETKGYSDSQQLPRGGYVCKIIGAKPIETKFGQSIKVAFDIAEGEFAGYYQQKYDANKNEDKKWPGTFLLNVPSDDGSTQDGWTKRKFRTFTDALEDSNTGYHTIHRDFLFSKPLKDTGSCLYSSKKYHCHGGECQ